MINNSWYREFLKKYIKRFDDECYVKDYLDKYIKTNKRIWGIGFDNGVHMEGKYLSVWCSGEEKDGTTFLTKRGPDYFKKFINQKDEEDVIICQSPKS